MTVTIHTVVHWIAVATSDRDEISPMHRSTGDARRTGVRERRESAVIVNMLSE